MAKAMNKGKKLDFIVSEIAKIKKLLKTLAAQQSELASQTEKPARVISKRPSKTPARKSRATSEPPAVAAKAKRPVLVKAVEGAQVTGRTGS
jgi:hypothetical protein